MLSLLTTVSECKRQGSSNSLVTAIQEWLTGVRFQSAAHIFQFKFHPNRLWGPPNLSFSGDEGLPSPDVKQQGRTTHKTHHFVLKLRESRAAAPILLISSRYGV